MALVKCKECGEEVSTKAKICPKCGAKAPKKTSIFTWLILVFIIVVVYSVNQNPTSTSKNSASPTAISSNSTNQQKPSIPKKVAPPKPSWQSNKSKSKNEMTGAFSAYAFSPRVYPSDKMSFPYSDVTGQMGVGCDAESEWVYFSFNSAPNLANGETKNGYNLIKTRVKWDELIWDVVLTQDWGAKYIHFRNDNSAISKVASSNSALLELQWHGQQPAYFNFTLNGSSKALTEMRVLCAKGK
jgi:RNA polymerase subunit RPABC4/transcription elongation factor Spt4